MIEKLKPHIQANDKYAFTLAICILFILNFLIYGLHYLGFKIFPWDFIGTYYAVPYFWTTCAQHGLFPTWISQQAMGYPLMMNLQSGLFYPPLWLLVLLHKTYTFHTAVVIQCLHVFAGAVGMFYLARLMRLPWFYCLLAGIGYHFFGGFYSNAQHVDIIRGYALIPWLLAGIVLTKNKNDALKAAILIPLATLFIFTGAYPGIGMATAFMIAMFLLFQLIAPITDIPLKKRFIAIIIKGLWFSLGVLLSQIYLLAPWLLRNQIDIGGVLSQQIPHTFFTLKNFFSLFLTANTPIHYIQDLSMRTTFITLPLFGLLFLTRFKRIKQNLAWILLLAVAIGMVTGSQVYHLATTILPFLRYSPPVCADYRAYIAIPLILTAVMALYDLMKNPLTKRALVVRNIFLFGIVIWGVFVIYQNGIHFGKIIELSAFMLLWLIFCILAFRTKQNPHLKTLTLTFIIAFVIINGFAMWYQNTNQWKASSYNNRIQFNSIYINKLQTKNIINSVKGHEFRPQRLNINIDPPRDWRGYLTGIYVLRDYVGGMRLARQLTIISNPLLLKFMELPSSYMLFTPKTKISINMLTEHVSQKKILSTNTKAVHMLHYANNAIIYNIKLSKPTIMVENETFFPGWQGEIIFQDGRTIKIKAHAAAGLLRAWQLPAGHYKLVTSFRMPYLHWGIMLSILGLILWIIGLAIVIKKYRHRDI